jgi:outer membrane protein OmpA-like peptidoglycan-associated protein
VVDYLMGKGIGAARIQSAGYGDTRPVAQNNSEANRAKNRRIEFKVTKN